MNANLKPADRVLFVGEARGFYCLVPHVTTAIRPTLLVDASEAPGADVRAWLRSRRFTHVLLSGIEMKRFAEEVGPETFESRDPRAREALRRFFAEDAATVYSDDHGLTVLAVR